MAIITTEALVLKRWDLRETSLLVSFFTRGLGKITGELKGIRADQRKFSSAADIFSLNDIVFYQKRNSSVHLVSQCDLKEGFPGVRRDLRLIGIASVLCELIDGVTVAEDPHPEIFGLALEALNELARSSFPEKIISIFKIKTISFSGFKPHLDSCVSCGSSSGGQFRFSTSLGGLLCSRCRPKDLKSRQIFRGTIATIQHIEKNDFRNSLKLGINPQIKRELDFVLNSFFEFHFGKRLKSEHVLHSLKLNS
jgi:DNA repair protein RecO (recombination protein O)